MFPSSDPHLWPLLGSGIGEFNEGMTVSISLEAILFRFCEKQSSAKHLGMSQFLFTSTLLPWQLIQSQKAWNGLFFMAHLVQQLTKTQLFTGYLRLHEGKMRLECKYKIPVFQSFPLSRPHTSGDRISFTRISRWRQIWVQRRKKPWKLYCRLVLSNVLSFKLWNLVE